MMSSYFDSINTLLYPYVLGFWSENNGGEHVVTTRDCDRFRGLGSRRWSTFTESPNNIFNTRLEVVTFDDLNAVNFDSTPDNVAGFYADFLKRERIEDDFKAMKLVEQCRPFFLALHGDLQAQHHYCLTVQDPMTTVEKQNVAYIFPGTQMDLYDALPEEEVTRASPMVGGSLGWLAHLTPFEKTLESIATAKKRLE
jgi:hypothetical protein